MPETIIILDFGSQYSQLIARRVREAQVYAELLPWDASAEAINDVKNPKGVILSGGPNSVYESEAPRLPEWVLDADLPVLGICYGMQLLTLALGGTVTSSDQREYGLAEISLIRPSALFSDNDSTTVWMSHGDRVADLPPGFNLLARSANSPFAAMGNAKRQIYGLQFHPEVRHTPAGSAILRRFVHDICGCRGDWTAQSIIDQAVDRIRQQVGTQKVLSAVSGGVDSSVATALVQRAVGNQLSAVFVDTGLMRKDERHWVEQAFRAHLGSQLLTIEAHQTFFEHLQDVSEPEQKRRIIGETFIRIFEDAAHQFNDPPFLVQGTIYPDVIESRAPERSHAHRIKTHHNVGGLPEKMAFDLVEPLRYLFKDEVRQVGEALGLPPALVWRQPFPGPGLAVRCLGNITPPRIATLRAADAIFNDILAEDGLLQLQDDASGTSQAFAVLLPVQAVGVMGDQRTYAEVIALRAVTTEDFMTADWARLPYDVLARAATRIINEVPGVNRVVYDITSKPPATIEWE